MLREETVFGPIHSRRLGTSLGINLLPEKGKFCNFDCIYCECGWNRDGRNDTKLPTAEKVRHDLNNKLQDLYADGVKVDSITFSGDGEPTLNPEFPQII
nr:radical SAM protein [Bacteroidales bacterium]